MESNFPPHMETYFQDKENGFVFVSKLNKEKEVNENIRMAGFLAKKTNENIFILPHIQPTHKEAQKLRNEYFPKGVKHNKNPDFFSKNRFVDAKSMNHSELNTQKLTKRNIQNRLKEAFIQADDAYLETPTSFPVNWVIEAIKGKLNSTSHYHIVYLRHGDNLIIIEP